MERSRATLGSPFQIEIEATDPDGDELEYSFVPSVGSIESAGALAVWKAGRTDPASIVLVDVTVGDGKDTVSASASFRINRKPDLSITTPPQAAAGETVRIDVIGGSDPDGDQLNFEWSSSGGTFRDATGRSTYLTLPERPMTVSIHCAVTDGWESWPLRSLTLTAR